MIWKMTFHEKTFLSLDIGFLLFHMCVNFNPSEKTLAEFSGSKVNYDPHTIKNTKKTSDSDNPHVR